MNLIEKLKDYIVSKIEGISEFYCNKLDYLRGRAGKVPSARTKFDRFLRSFIVPSKKKLSGKTMFRWMHRAPARDRYNKLLRKHYKIYYSVSDSFIYLRSKWQDLRYLYLYYFVYRYYKVDVDTGRHHIPDADQRILYAAFQCLVDFVHKDMVRCHGYNLKEKSIEEYLKDNYVSLDLESYDYLKEKTIYDLYMWWVHYRPMRYVMSRANGDDKDFYSDMDYYKIDEAMLDRLMKIRIGLWF